VGQVKVFEEAARAAVQADVPRLVRALDAGADPNGLDTEGRTLLECAIDGNSFEAVKLVIDRGADVNGTSPMLGPALHYAIDMAVQAAIHAEEMACRPVSPRVDIVRYLIEHGARIDSLDPEGRTPLDVAYDRGSDESTAYNPTAVRLLESLGASRNRRRR
jgi:ankyrin repeat protein